MAFDLGAAITAAGQLSPAIQQVRAQRIAEAQQKAALEGQQAATQYQQLTNTLKQREIQNGVLWRKYQGPDGSEHEVYLTPNGLKDYPVAQTPEQRYEEITGVLKKSGEDLTPEQEAEIAGSVYGVKGLVVPGWKPLPGKAGESYQGMDGLFYQNGTDPAGNIVPKYLGPNYQPPVAAITPYQQALSDYRKSVLDWQKDPKNPMTQYRMKEANARLEQAQAQSLNSQGRNIGSYNGNPLAGALLDTEGNTIGSGFASQYSKLQGQLAQLNDARGAIQTTLAPALDALYSSGGSLNSPAVAEALANHQWAAEDVLQGIVAKTLSPQERLAVVAIKSARENIQGMRKAAGGGLSNAQVDRLVALLPSAATPNEEYSKLQLQMLNQTLSRLVQGVPNTVGGSRFGQEPNAAPPANPPASSKGAPKTASEYLKSVGVE